MTKEHGSTRLVRWLIGIVTVLIAVFSAITIIQIKWTTGLQNKLTDTRQQIQSLRTKCAEKLLQDVLLSEHSVNPNRIKRQGGSLQTMLQEMMVAQEKILLSHCLNNTGLCVKGTQGLPGLKGDMGIPGTIGQPGSVGIAGLKGDMGQTGPAGDKGDRGIAGSRGTNGQTGPTGPRGPKGYKGQHGISGPNGVIGLSGQKGAKGAHGDIGMQGLPGANGKIGLHGKKGDTGPVGLKGTMGPPGPKGQTGALLQKDCMCIKKPVIDTFPRSGHYSIGNHVTFKCDSSSIPKPKITWYLPTGGCGTKSVSDKVLDIPSLQPSQLGLYRCDATNVYGTISKTFNLQGNLARLLDCDFGNPDMCKWSNDANDIGSWQLHHGPTSTSSTGPTADHTTGSPSGYYLYTDSLTNRRNNPVLMRSPELEASGPACLSFWYHMYGRDEGSLVVQAKNNCNGSTSTYKTISGNQGDEWHLAEIQLPALPKNHTLIFKSVQGNGILSDVAIDDIKYYDGQCNATLFRTGPAEHNITISVGKKLDLNCGIEGYPQPTIQWKTPDSCATQGSTAGPGKRMANQRSYIGSYGNSGGSTYGNTGGSSYGNTNGRTYGNIGGGTYGNTGGGSYGNSGGSNYGNIGGSSYGNTGSGTYGHTGGGSYGKKVVMNPQVQLSTQDTGQVSSDEILTVTNYTVHGHEGTYTCTANVPGAQPLSTTFNVKVKGSGFDKCTFESGLCGWTQDKADIFDWTMLSGPTGSVETGPPYDHTIQSSRGKYMYIEASSPRGPGHYAVMRSPLMKANQTVCFSFYYNMYGVDTGNLTIMLEDVCTHKRTPIFLESGDQGQSWLHQSVNISAGSVPNDYHVLVRASVGGSFHSDIAIDDLVLSSGSCNATKAVDTYADCDFDSGLCLWTQSTTDNFNWDRRSGSTPSSSTGPDGDHTSSKGHGYYLYTEASNQNQNQKADLVSPVIPGLDQEYCLHMATNMYGSTMGSIVVYVLENGNRQEKTTYNQRSSSSVWKIRRIYLGRHTQPFQVIIEGVIGTSYYSDAAIDDVKVTSGPC